MELGRHKCDNLSVRNAGYLSGRFSEVVTYYYNCIQKMPTKSRLLDVRPRKTLIESFYVEHLHSTTRFLVAQPEDLPILLNYVEDEAPEFLNATSVENFTESLNQSLVVLATDCFEVCGLVVGQISNKNGNENLPGIGALNGKTLQVSLLNVCAEYQNAKIEYKLLKELFKLAHKLEVGWVTTTSPQTIQLCDQLKAANKLSFTGNEKHILINLNEQKEFLTNDPPSLPEAYRLDPNIKRRVLGQYFAKPLGRSLDYVVAAPGDEEVVGDFLSNEYFRQTAITRSLQCRKEDGKELITRYKPECIKYEMVFLAVDQGRICGLAVNKAVKVDHPVVPMDEKIPADFTPEIEKQTLTHLGSCAIRALCKWMDDLTPQMLNGCKEYLVLDMLTTTPDYRGCKVGWKLWYESLKFSQQLGYEYTQTICTAIGSNKLAEKFNMRRVIEFPYTKLTYKGKMLLPDGVYDGGPCICLYVGKSDELKFDP